MRFVFSFLFFLFCTSIIAQPTITKYYDREWLETSKQKATYYAEFKKSGQLYVCTSYWLKNYAVRGISLYGDTIMNKPVGWQKLYYPNGSLEDSSFYDEQGYSKEVFYFYPNQQLELHYYQPPGKKPPVFEAYDQRGKPIKDYIIFREAEFNGGAKAWENYLQANVSKSLSTARSKEKTTVTLQVLFTIDEKGLVTHPRVVQSSGYSDVDVDALKVIAASPPWSNAIVQNKPAKSVRIQPFTYVLLPNF